MEKTPSFVDPADESKDKRRTHLLVMMQEDSAVEVRFQRAVDSILKVAWQDSRAQIVGFVGSQPELVPGLVLEP